jgi:hypothetical protein
VQVQDEHVITHNIYSARLWPPLHCDLVADNGLLRAITGRVREFAPPQALRGQNRHFQQKVLFAFKFRELLWGLHVFLGGEERGRRSRAMATIPLEVLQEHVWPRLHQLQLLPALETIVQIGPSSIEDLPDLLNENEFACWSDNPEEAGWSSRVQEALLAEEVAGIS